MATQHSALPVSCILREEMAECSSDHHLAYQKALLYAEYRMETWNLHCVLKPGDLNTFVLLGVF
jgi:hypothetical protein